MTYSELRKIEIVMIRILSYVRRFCGNEELGKMLEYIEKAIMSLRMLQVTMRAIEMAEGPIGWAYAGVSMLGAGIMVGTEVYDVTRSGS